MGDPMMPLLYNVEKKIVENHDTFTLFLTPQQNSIGEYSPGQFNMMYAFGVGEVPISISGHPSQSHSLVHTIRAVGTVTRAMQKITAGATIGLRGPFGTCWPMEKAQGKDVVVMAGGIGLAPLRPILYHILANRSHFGRLILLYGARTPHDLIFGDELSQWEQLFTVKITVDYAESGWKHHVGVVTELLKTVEITPENSVAMICGPEIMMRYSALGLMQRQVRPDNIYITMERNMKCAIGFCGHCQYGPAFICKDGPVFAYPDVERWLQIREL